MVGVRESPKLHDAIRRFQGGERIQGIHVETITRIFPMIVFLDKSFTSPYFSTLYKDSLDRATLGHRPVVTSPFAVTVGDIESVLPSTQEHDLSEILDEYYRCNRTSDGSLSYGRLAHANIPLLRNAGRGKDIVRDRFSQFNDDLIASIFDSGSDPAANASKPHAL